MAKKPVLIGGDRARSKAATQRHLESMFHAGVDPMAIAATAILDMDARDRADNSTKASVARAKSERRLKSMLDAGADPMAIAATAISDMDVRDRVRGVNDDEAGRPPAIATQEFKVLVVLDCYRKSEFSMQEVKENAPDFIDAILCRDYLPDGSPYRFSNPCLYIDISDFDLDRGEQLDHFAPEVAARWIHSPRAADMPDPTTMLATPEVAPEAAPTAANHFKTILVLDCERANDFSIQDVFENAPSFIDYKLGDSAERHYLTSAAASPYHFSNASLYVDINDFDLDRSEHLDHFSPEVAQYWRSPSPVIEEPSVN